MNNLTKRILDGIAIILKYEPSASFACEHDIMYFGSYDSRENMTVEEKQKMAELGWIEQYESWAHFV